MSSSECPICGEEYLDKLSRKEMFGEGQTKMQGVELCIAGKTIYIHSAGWSI